MKKKVIVISIFLFLITTIIWLLYFKGIIGNKPFKHLNKSDISSISVLGSPPNRTVVINKEEQIDEVVDTLNTVPTYQKVDSSKIIVGQLIQFTLTMKDGSILKLKVFTPTIVINGQSYLSKYGFCEELNALGNKLLKN
ncbi:hypothetical protein LL033_25735 (plasmid) [Clostridium estertheticum]|uniref:hypothetical protein n=1 Tax=Clostridium estertheticum TaxID=238834 RepID=UPI001C0BCBB7|nr:hypothetical protein [Clostridium estertheticum]MBU3217385.1 hypothetical protein [Clostridium estertheticum]WAG58161.1 hypothetical protein LL033_25735 [Clostridium estertheticum]